MEGGVTRGGDRVVGRLMRSDYLEHHRISRFACLERGSG